MLFASLLLGTLAVAGRCGVPLEPFTWREPFMVAYFLGKAFLAEYFLRRANPAWMFWCSCVLVPLITRRLGPGRLPPLHRARNYMFASILLLLGCASLLQWSTDEDECLVRIEEEYEWLADGGDCGGPSLAEPVENATHLTFDHTVYDREHASLAAAPTWHLAFLLLSVGVYPRILFIYHFATLGAHLTRGWHSDLDEPMSLVDALAHFSSSFGLLHLTTGFTGTFVLADIPWVLGLLPHGSWDMLVAAGHIFDDSWLRVHTLFAFDSPIALLGWVFAPRLVIVVNAFIVWQRDPLLWVHEVPIGTFPFAAEWTAAGFFQFLGSLLCLPTYIFFALAMVRITLKEMQYYRALILEGYNAAAGPYVPLLRRRAFWILRHLYFDLAQVAAPPGFPWGLITCALAFLLVGLPLVEGALVFVLSSISGGFAVNLVSFVARSLVFVGASMLLGFTTAYEGDNGMGVQVFGRQVLLIPPAVWNALVMIPQGVAQAQPPTTPAAPPQPVHWPPPLHVPDEKEGSAPEQLICPISRCVMRSPAVTPAGTSYDYEALATWIAANHKYPMNERPGELKIDDLAPNLVVRNLVQEFIDTRELKSPPRKTEAEELERNKTKRQRKNASMDGEAAYLY